jgi:outer membrane protein assembly factor BamB
MNARTFRSLAVAVGITLLSCVTARADDWPQWRGPTRDDVWHETGLVDRFASAELTPRWRAPIASGYSGPTVAAGRVYVTDRVVEPKQIERVHCFDEQTGKPLWKHEYDCQYKVGYPAGPRASVSIDDGRAYSLGTMGNLFCFAASDGKILWQKDLLDEYKIRMPIWGIAASPLVTGELVIVQIGGEENACLVAFDKRSGKERWRALDDQASYCAPVLTEQAGKTVLVCVTGDNVVGLDPTSGTVHWKYPFPPSRMVITIATPIIEENHLFVTSFYDGSLMLRLDPKKLAVEKIWRRQGADEKHTDGLHSIISTPLMIGNYVYGVDSYGELRCLDADTGDRRWESLDATPMSRWSTIHMVRNGDRVWMFNERGELIIARLSPSGYEEISRAKLIEPTTEQLRQRGGVCWAHPAFANRHVFVRNDNELIAASLADKQPARP